jgi:predicted  nucleic acid-binding Zn-ribbon protein
MSGHTPSTNHKVIWLEPHCVPAGEQRSWCEDNVWENGCPDCGAMPTKYVRADAHDALVEALEEARDLIKFLDSVCPSNTAGKVMIKIDSALASAKGTTE